MLTPTKNQVNAVCERARELFDSKQHNCAESVFMAVNEVLTAGSIRQRLRALQPVSAAGWAQQVERAGP